jgi:hypothetical protein
VELRTPWLGRTRGHLSDWVTQRWVQVTGRSVRLDAERWLAGPMGTTERIGDDFFDSYAQRIGAGVRGGAALMPAFSALDGPGFDASKVDPRVRDFYENTARYELDVESRWSRLFRPFGALLAMLFSRRLEQLNVPLDALGARQAMASRIVHVVDPRSGTVAVTGWVRRNRATAETVYVGAYSIAIVPARVDPCVKVVFPLPNGSATVLLRPSVEADGSLLLDSSGDCFGDAGFYFVVAGERDAWARHVRSFRECIHVYLDDDGALRTDHVFTLFGVAVLRLHYRLTRIAEEAT